MTVKPHRPSVHPRHHHHHRTEHRPRTVADVLDRLHHRRHESGFDNRPDVRDHRRPNLDGNYPQPYRPVESYTGYTGPAQYPAPPQSGGSYGGGYPNVGDPGFTPPAYGPELPPNGGDPWAGAPVYGSQLPNASAPIAPTEDQIQETFRKYGPATGEQTIEGIRSHMNDFPAMELLAIHQDMAKDHPEMLSAESHTCIGILEKYAKTAGPDGKISPANLDKMYAEMSSVKDASMYHALNGLQGSRISGAQMGDAIIRGCSDTDGKGNSTELAQLKQWAQDNAGRLSPAAKMAIDGYVKIAEASAARGAPGLTAGEMGKVRIGMRNAALADDLQ